MPCLSYFRSVRERETLVLIFTRTLSSLSLFLLIWERKQGYWTSLHLSKFSLSLHITSRIVIHLLDVLVLTVAPLFYDRIMQPHKWFLLVGLFWLWYLCYFDELNPILVDNISRMLLISLPYLTLPYLILRLTVPLAPILASTHPLPLTPVPLTPASYLKQGTRNKTRNKKAEIKPFILRSN